MGLKDDLETMERHSRNGTLNEWFEGTAPPLPEEHIPDPSAREGQSNYVFLVNRGD